MNIINRIKRKANYFLRRLINIQKQKVLVLGDSHVGVFNYINKKYKYPLFFEVGYVSGATALGIGSENSKTKALEILKKS